MARTETLVHLLGKWADLDTPGAAGLNFNWDTIDANLVKCSGAFPATYPINKLLIRTDLLAFYINTGTPSFPIWTSLPVIPPGFTDANRAELALGKKFFTQQGLLPANIIREDLYTFPAPDFSNLHGGSLVRNMSIAKFLVGSVPANFGWALGATYSKVLMILGGVRATAGFYLGLAVGTAATHAANERQRGYHIGWEPSSVSGRIYKADGVGGDSSLASETDHYITFVAANQPTTGLAIYVDDATGRVIFFVRYGSEQWWPVHDITDATYSGFKSCSVMSYANGNAYLGCPLGIYAK